jgi:hypothetical protein
MSSMPVGPDNKPLGIAANPFRTQSAAESYAAVALTSPPANLTAGADTTLTFASAVKVVYVENNTGEDKNLAFDTAATAGSRKLLDGEAREYVVACTAVHVYGASASPVNGSAAGNLIVEGRG